MVNPKSIAIFSQHVHGGGGGGGGGGSETETRVLVQSLTNHLWSFASPQQRIAVSRKNRRVSKLFTRREAVNVRIHLNQSRRSLIFVQPQPPGISTAIIALD